MMMMTTMTPYRFSVPDFERFFFCTAFRRGGLVEIFSNIFPHQMNTSIFKAPPLGFGNVHYSMNGSLWNTRESKIVPPYPQL